MATGPTPPAQLPVQDQPVPGARSALILLIAINLFNFMDRNILAAVEPKIRKHFFPTEIDPTTNFRAAWLSGPNVQRAAKFLDERRVLQNKGS